MIIVALGANLPSPAGDATATLHAALAAMPAYGIRPVHVSSFHHTAPMYLADQPEFVNAVAVVETGLAPHVLLAVLLQIEAQFGRVRTIKNSARTLDLDVIAYDDRQISDADLTLPHPLMAERGFVLYPLREVAPNWAHPVTKKTVDQMIDGLEKSST